MLKNEYLSLHDYLIDIHMIFVYDSSMYGPGVSIHNNNSFNGVIVVDGNLTYDQKFFVLLHEMGHLLKFNEFISLRKKAGNETQANNFACKLLKRSHPELIKPYVDYYNSFNEEKYVYGKKKKLQPKRTRSTKKAKGRK